MSEYKTIFGKAIKSLSSDPTDAGAEGQIWYNTTTGSFRTVLATGAWSSGGNLLSPNAYSAGFGIQTAAIDAGGNTYATTQEYDGSSWSSNPNLNTGRRSLASANLGTVTAGLVFGGFNPDVPAQYANTESWNGTTWSEVNDLPAYSGNFAGFGTQTAAVAFQSPSPGSQSIEWDGTNWGSTAPTNTSRPSSIGNGTGTQTAGLIVGGGPTPTVAGAVEEYDGSTWTSGTSYPESVYKNAVTGVQTSAYAFSGSLFPSPTQPTATNSYNGTTWTAQPTIGSARYAASEAGGSSGTSALLFGGYAGATPPISQTNATEEFSYSIYAPIAATWASGGNINTAREAMAGAGTQTAALISGGNIYPNSIQNLSEEYNGTTWTEGNNLTTSRRKLVGAGTQTAAVVFGGTTTAPVAPGATGKTEEYDGTSYTEQNDMNTARLSLMGAGLQDAAWAAGGLLATSTYSTATELYDGTSWTTSPATLNTARGDAGSAGTQTAALIFGGISASPLTANSEEFNGTTWSEGNNIPAATRQMASFGTQTYAVGAGGGDSPDNRTTAFVYDGTSWTNTASLSTGREHLAGSGYGTQPGSTGLAVGGSQDGNPMNAQTEEFTGEIVQLDYKTISDS